MAAGSLEESSGSPQPQTEQARAAGAATTRAAARATRARILIAAIWCVSARGARGCPRRVTSGTPATAAAPPGPGGRPQRGAP